MIKTLYINTDGGARGNPGLAACAFVIHDELRNLVYQEGKLLGITTNNVAEYEGVILSLVWLKNHPETLNNTAQIIYRLDSLLVVNQLLGNFKVKETHLRELFAKATKLKNELKISITFSYVPRDQNSKADSLLNQLLDK